MPLTTAFHHLSTHCITRRAFIACLATFIVLGATGCVMQRTVKEGDEVIAQGYVVKSPL
jgi:hypothetical protein